MASTRTYEVPYFLRKTSRFAIDVNIFPRQRHHFVGIIELVKLKAQLTFFQVKLFLTYNAQHFIMRIIKVLLIICHMTIKMFLLLVNYQKGHQI